jgi:hypothetical protein
MGWDLPQLGNSRYYNLADRAKYNKLSKNNGISSEAYDLKHSTNPYYPERDSLMNFHEEALYDRLTKSGKVIDPNKDGVITYNEFIQSSLSIKQLTMEQLSAWADAVSSPIIDRAVAKHTQEIKDNLPVVLSSLD